MSYKDQKKLNIQPTETVLEYYKAYEKKQDLHKQIIENATFNIPRKYELIELIGQGAYGYVGAFLDQNEKEKIKQFKNIEQFTDQQVTNISNKQKEFKKLVAIKKIEKAFEHRIYTKRTLRELKLLRLLKHENIMNLETILLPETRGNFEDLYIVCELMHSDLATIIRDKTIQIGDEEIQFFLYQILRGLKYIHSAGVIHRDLKPRNLLVNQNCDLKICDFGLARAMVGESTGFTDYMQTRWYRSPELLLNRVDYSTEVDVWSVGVILAEMLLGRPFFPGQSTEDQLFKIFHIMGTPDKKELFKMSQDPDLVQRMPQMKAQNFKNLFPSASEECLDLIKKMLVFNPEKRITIEEALKHPYLSYFQDDADEPTCQKLNEWEFEFEIHDLTREQYKDLIYEEILMYHFPQFQKDWHMKLKNNQSVQQHIISFDNDKYLYTNDDEDYDSDEDSIVIQSSGSSYDNKELDDTQETPQLIPQKSSSKQQYEKSNISMDDDCKEIKLSYFAKKNVQQVENEQNLPLQNQQNYHANQIVTNGVSQGKNNGLKQNSYNNINVKVDKKQVKSSNNFGYKDKENQDGDYQYQQQKVKQSQKQQQQYQQQYGQKSQSLFSLMD